MRLILVDGLDRLSELEGAGLYDRASSDVFVFDGKPLWEKAVLSLPLSVIPYTDFVSSKYVPSNRSHSIPFFWDSDSECWSYFGIASNSETLLVSALYKMRFNQHLYDEVLIFVGDSATATEGVAQVVSDFDSELKRPALFKIVRDGSGALSKNPWSHSEELSLAKDSFSRSDLAFLFKCNLQSVFWELGYLCSTQNLSLRRVLDFLSQDITDSELEKSAELCACAGSKLDDLTAFREFYGVVKQVFGSELVIYVERFKSSTTSADNRQIINDFFGKLCTHIKNVG